MPDKLTDSMEDYLESVLIIMTNKGSVRVSDIADFMNVTKPSVVSALSTLEKRGLIVHERYGDVQMTDLGCQRANEIYKRHVAIRGFLQEVLGLKQSVAEEDACRMEHTLHPETIHRMSRYVNFVREQEEEEREFLKRFREYLET